MKKRFNLLPKYHFEENTDGKIKNAATRVLRDCRIFGATEFEPYKTVGDLDAESGKYVLPVTIGGKNLIPYPHFYLWHYPNGITFTDNGDGSITANGTSTGSAQYFWNFTPANFKLDKNATYIFSGCPRGGATDTYRLEFAVTKGDTTLLNKHDTGNGVVINGIPENYDRISVKPFIGRGTTVDNITFKPQLELGKTATEFEPYTAPKTTNLLLDAPLGVGESISCREKGLPVPELATLDPSITNCITFGSEVKPSGVTCEYYKY